MDRKLIEIPSYREGIDVTGSILKLSGKTLKEYAQFFLDLDQQKSYLFSCIS